MLTVPDSLSHSTAGAADPIWSLGTLMTLKTRSPELEVIEALALPGISPPLHRHDFGSESFYVIEGGMRVLVGDSEVTLGPGDLVRIPPSTPHTFMTLGDEPTRVLDILAPAGLWDFFVECGEPATELRVPDAVVVPPDLAEIVTRYDGKVLGPPLAR
jgi:mannose-6-phosphate isomerase-like protein (cupin superfamily)